MIYLCDVVFLGVFKRNYCVHIGKEIVLQVV